MFLAKRFFDSLFSMTYFITSLDHPNLQLTLTLWSVNVETLIWIHIFKRQGGIARMFLTNPYVTRCNAFSLQSTCSHPWARCLPFPSPQPVSVCIIRCVDWKCLQNHRPTRQCRPRSRFAHARSNLATKILFFQQQLKKKQTIKATCTVCRQTRLTLVT